MPYHEHPAFSVPNWDATIWRYISLPQLISILKNKALYFSRSDLLDDPFEGTLPTQNTEEYKSDPGDVQLPQKATIIKYADRKTADWTTINLRSRVRTFQRISHLNCWHVMPHESVAMWKANTNSPSAVAIKSRASKLRESFSSFKSNDVFIGKVKYIDYETERIPDENVLYSFAYKRNGFKHENELRAVITSLPLDGYPEFVGKMVGQTISFDWESQPPGMYVPINVDKLINDIHLSPSVPRWYKPLLDDLVSKYGYDFSVCTSSLAVQPEWHDQS